MISSTLCFYICIYTGCNSMFLFWQCKICKGGGIEESVYSLKKKIIEAEVAIALCGLTKQIFFFFFGTIGKRTPLWRGGWLTTIGKRTPLWGIERWTSPMRDARTQEMPLDYQGHWLNKTIFLDTLVLYEIFCEN